MRIIIRVLCLLLLVGASVWAYRNVSWEVLPQSATAQNGGSSQEEQAKQRIRTMADSARRFAQEKGLNTNYCLLVDFRIHSGKKRLFLWDFKGDSVRLFSLCAHGYGKNSTPKTPVFSNVEGSYCSSLGRYRIGERSYSKWGINVHYKMHGLDSTNSNAFKRWVVLHSYDPVPEHEIYPIHLSLGYSQGCPVISNETMRALDELLKKEKKSLLLWIYY